jgi:hypothetical protein
MNKFIDFMKDHRGIIKALKCNLEGTNEEDIHRLAPYLSNLKHLELNLLLPQAFTLKGELNTKRLERLSIRLWVPSRYRISQILSSVPTPLHYLELRWFAYPGCAREAISALIQNISSHLIKCVVIYRVSTDCKNEFRTELEKHTDLLDCCFEVLEEESQFYYKFNVIIRAKD